MGVRECSCNFILRSEDVLTTHKGKCNVCLIEVSGLRKQINISPSVKKCNFNLANGPLANHRLIFRTNVFTGNFSFNHYC
jgi:hypothetical protein